MPPCPPGDAFAAPVVLALALLSCAMVAAILWFERAWAARQGLARLALAVVVGVAGLAFILGDIVGPLADQALLQAGGRPAEAELLRQYDVRRRRGSDTLVDYRFVAELPGGACQVLRRGEELLWFDRGERAGGEQVAVRYLPDQPHVARVTPTADVLRRQLGLALLFVIVFPALFLLRRVVADMLAEGRAGR